MHASLPTNTYLSAIDRWLGEHVAAMAAEETTRFDAWLADLRGPLIVYGAGGLGRKLARGLAAEGVAVSAFADSNPAVWGATAEGLPILSPDSAVAEAGTGGGFVIATWSLGTESRNADIRESLHRRGVTNTIFFTAPFWRYPQRFLPHYRLDLPSKLLAARPQVIQAARLFTDRSSRDEFFTQLRMLVTDTFTERSYGTPGPTYFARDLLAPTATEWFVDCGAYDGDTLDSLLAAAGGRITGYHGLEPDPRNFELLRSRVQSISDKVVNRCDIRPIAVGRRREQLRFAATGDVIACVKGDGTTIVESVPLDELLANTTPTFIKMDVEGAELNGIEGGRKVIATHAPVMAVCVYHEQAHLWEIPLALANLLPQAIFALRFHHSTYDVVCYAVPRHRCFLGR